jgi:hypothetical protein
MTLHVRILINVSMHVYYLPQVLEYSYTIEMAPIIKVYLTWKIRMHGSRASRSISAM